MTVAMTLCLDSSVEGRGGPCVSSSGPHNLPSLFVPEASPIEVPPSSRVQERSFFIRMKSTLTKRGLHVKASGYKVGVSSLPQPLTPGSPPWPKESACIHASSVHGPPWSSRPTGPALPSSDRACHLQVIHVTGRLRARALGLVALGHTLPPAPLAELPLHGHMIVFRLSLGLTILACESRYRGWGLRWEDGGARERGVGRKSEELGGGGGGGALGSRGRRESRGGRTGRGSEGGG